MLFNSLIKFVKILLNKKNQSYLVVFSISLLSLFGTEYLVVNRLKENFGYEFQNLGQEIQSNYNRMILPLKSINGLLKLKNYNITEHEFNQFLEGQDNLNTVTGSIGAGLIETFPEAKVKYLIQSKNNFNLNNEVIINKVDSQLLNLKNKLKINSYSAVTLSPFKMNDQWVQAILLPAYVNQKSSSKKVWSFMIISINERIKSVVPTLHLPLNFALFDENQNNIYSSRNSYINEPYDYSGQINILGSQWSLKATTKNESGISFLKFSSWYIFSLVLLIGLFVRNHIEKIERFSALQENALKQARDEISHQVEIVIRQKNFLNHIINHNPSLIAYFDIDGLCKIKNLSFQSYFNLNESSDNFLHLQSLNQNQNFSQIIDNLIQAFNGQFSKKEVISHFFQIQNHHLFHFIPDIVSQKVVGVLIVGLDLTLIREMEKEQKQFESQLIAKSQLSSLGEMASGIAHEINNPLAIISGKIQRMKKYLSLNGLNENSLADAQVDLEKIDSTIDRIAKIVTGLRTFSRDSHNEEKTNCDIKALIEDTLALCSEKTRLKNIDIQLSCSEGLSAYCNPVQFSQVFMNLINNSIDAIDQLDIKWIDIKVTSINSQVRIEFTDSGHGIPSELRDKIMNPFFTTKPLGKGTGLGLSISRGIIENHNGHLFYDPSSRNTKFIIEIPLNKATSKASDAEVA